MSEKAKGRAWDTHRTFSVGKYGTTENLMQCMAAALRRAVPELIDLTPTLTEALGEIEGTIQTIGGAILTQAKRKSSRSLMNPSQVVKANLFYGDNC